MRAAPQFSPTVQFKRVLDLVKYVNLQKSAFFQDWDKKFLFSTVLIFFKIFKMIFCVAWRDLFTYEILKQPLKPPTSKKIINVRSTKFGLCYM